MKNLALFLPRALLLALWLPLSGAAADLVLAVTPRFAPEEILARIAPLKERLEAALGKSIDILVTADFKDFEERLKAGQIDIAHVNPIIYPAASEVHEAVAMTAEDAGPQLRGVIITRADSGMVTFDDLKGRRISYVGPKSIGGYLSQRLALEQAGVDPATLTLEEARDNKQENVILSVYYGDVDAGFINEDALHVADGYFPAHQIRVMQRGAWMPSWAISVKRTLPDALKSKVRDTVVGLSPGDPVLTALKVKAFVPGTDADYDPVRLAAGMPIPQR